MTQRVDGGKENSMRWFLTLISGFILVGCMTSGATLRHPTTGQTVKCGPYMLKFSLGYKDLERCLDDYQRQGYERVPD
jgi:hypothetical protein